MNIRRLVIGLALVMPMLFSANVFAQVEVGIADKFDYCQTESDSQNQNISFLSSDDKDGAVEDFVSESCDRCWRPYFGVEATFLSERTFGSNNTITFNDLVPVATRTLATDANDAFTGAPRLWFGIAGENGWGVQTRYWQMKAFASSVDLFDPLDVTDTGTSASSALNMYTVDAEITRDLSFKCWDLVASLGYRHAAFDRSESITGSGFVVHAGGNDLFTGSAVSTRAFEGDGLTFALSGIKSVSDRWCFDLFWTARGSVLWGDSTASADTSSFLVGPLGSAASVNRASAGSSDQLGIFEGQLGIQWSHDIQSFHGRMFARVAMEYQYWHVNQGNAAAFSATGTVAQTSSVSTAGFTHRHMNLIGATASAGFIW